MFALPNQCLLQLIDAITGNLQLYFRSRTQSLYLIDHYDKILTQICMNDVLENGFMDWTVLVPSKPVPCINSA